MAIIFLIKKLAQSKGQAMEPPNGSDEALETKTHVVSVKKKNMFPMFPRHNSIICIYIYNSSLFLWSKILKIVMLWDLLGTVHPGIQDVPVY